MEWVVETLLEGLEMLFIPEEGYIENWFSDTVDSLSQALGFSILIEIIEGLTNVDGSLTASTFNVNISLMGRNFNVVYLDYAVVVAIAEEGRKYITATVYAILLAYNVRKVTKLIRGE